jgi:phosphonoacetate hydrolase
VRYVAYAPAMTASIPAPVRAPDPRALDAAVAALTAEDLAGIVDLVAYPVVYEGERAVVVARHDGAVRLTADGSHDVLFGRDPVAHTDPMAFLPYESEIAHASPGNHDNAYPHPGRRLLSFFADPGRSPDVAVVHTPRHYFPETGGHRGEHGSLDVIQSRAPFIVAGAGVVPAGVVHDHALTVDVTPTLLHAAGVDAERHVDADGAPLDGVARIDLVTGGAGRFVVGMLWDGAHCSDLLHLATTGELPGVARLLERGVALAGGAVAEFPSVTLCNHTSLLTGVGPGRHGVLGNVYYDRELGARVVPNDETTWHRSAEWLRPGVATVFESLAAAQPEARTVCINEAVDRGSHVSTMAVIRASAELRGSGGLEAALPPAESSPYLSDAAHLGDKYYRWATRVDEAGLMQLRTAWLSAAEAPRLTWWSQVVTDAGHHAGGPRSAIARDSLRDADRRLQAFLDHLDSLGVTDDVTFLLTADHGFETADESVTGSWAPALDAALDPLSLPYRDEGPGFVYLGDA